MTSCRMFTGEFTKPRRRLLQGMCQDGTRINLSTPFLPLETRSLKKVGSFVLMNFRYVTQVTTRLGKFNPKRPHRVSPRSCKVKTLGVPNVRLYFSLIFLGKSCFLRYKWISDIYILVNSSRLALTANFWVQMKPYFFSQFCWFII